MEALAWQPAAPAAGKEVKWAKGLTRNARGDLWCMAFQVGQGAAAVAALLCCPRL